MMIPFQNLLFLIECIVNGYFIMLAPPEAGARCKATAYLPSRNGDGDPRSYKHRSEHQYNFNLKEQKDLEMLQVDLLRTF